MLRPLLWLVLLSGLAVLVMIADDPFPLLVRRAAFPGPRPAAWSDPDDRSQAAGHRAEWPHAHRAGRTTTGRGLVGLLAAQAGPVSDRGPETRWVGRVSHPAAGAASAGGPGEPPAGVRHGAHTPTRLATAVSLTGASNGPHAAAGALPGPTGGRAHRSGSTDRAPDVPCASGDRAGGVPYSTFSFADRRDRAGRELSATR